MTEVGATSSVGGRCLDSGALELGGRKVGGSEWVVRLRGLFTSFKIVTTIDYINKTVPKSYAFTSVTLHSKHS